MNLENKKPKRSLRLKFFSVLALLLSVVGIVSYFSAKKKVEIALEGLTTATSGITQSINPSQLEEVNRNVTGIPDERYSETTMQEPTTAEFVKAETYCLPLGSTVINSFSFGQLIKSTTMNDWRVHNGTDFKGAAGDEVRAVNNGKVTDVYDDAMWGTVVEIDHGDGMTARYCGLQKGSTVKQGDIVRSDDVIGKLGQIPIEASDGEHLHFEILLGSSYQDPITAMNISPEQFSAG